MSGDSVVISGIGLVSSLGIGAEAHWNALSQGGAEPVLDAESFSPYTVHPLPDIDWNLQIAKRGDQRQMETWQRLGTFGAGLALDDAGMKGDEALCSTMDMVLASGGGERDDVVDVAILDDSMDREDYEHRLNERLSRDLRPTLFLAQLSNLLAGNISIVHKVTGSSRTFMGEEGAGIAALETAAARIRHGQSSHMLVGAAFQTEHPDMLLKFEHLGYLHRGPWQPVWNRRGSEGGGIVTGSGAAFLVLESQHHAEARGARTYASLGKIVSDRTRRSAQPLAEALGVMIGRTGAETAGMLAISAASGAHAATAAEREALANAGLVARGMSTMTGHLKEAQLLFAVALAALSISHGKAYPPFVAGGEAPFEGAPETILATAVGFHRYEGLALVTKV